jgi:Kyakuja-Dileera-Zisupton transposase
MCSFQYDIFPRPIKERLMFALTAMHAYGHEWACQIVYNPRIRVGLGLTDGEGVERLWSRLRKLIGITRCSGVIIGFSSFLLLISGHRDNDAYGLSIVKHMR